MLRQFDGQHTTVARSSDAVGRPIFRVITAEADITLTDEQAKEAVQGLVQVGWGGVL